MINVGIISFAHMHAYSYAKALKELSNVNFLGVFDEDLKRGQDAARQFGVDFYDEVGKLLSKLDAVILCTINIEHAKYTKLAAQNRVHVLSEKPLATNTADALEMIKACRENGVHLMTAFPIRFNEPVIRAKEIVDSGDLGDILSITGTNHGTMPGGWFIDKTKSGGGSVMDHTVHVADLMRWFIHDEVSEVYAEIGNLIYKDIDVEDCGLLTFQFNNGAIATLDASWSRPRSFPTWGDVTMRIVGTKGIIYVDAFAQSLSIYNNDRMKGLWDFWGTNSDYEMIKSFVESVEKDVEPKVTGIDGLRALEITLSAYKAAETKDVVKNIINTV
ncbi:Gfo/Idh/MocA family oxidoreductase [Thermoanaerobacterium sp. CMT5567-10]|uniref:Gfo/Idh/MocA family protein n=1 Tax=Thermoanaerobacterium sp. CMT5567-10 TaxID=3061989 RepID=UPI0026DF77C3|nr:Gfo/Idh/MocA family oxidoreductase [Thermoanaerobacterium sp. CMT5567-10]WKV10157.1 Gfo/Idh/MocA family oxidoreductase [Thermoanaerobacterium sp. CMT5567-10]